jgi:hypothetical protein
MVVRAKIILFAASGLDNEETSYRLDMPRQVVSKWRKRFFFQRVDGLDDQPGRGTTALFFSLKPSLRSKLSPANSPANWGFPFPVSVMPTSPVWPLLGA